MTSTTHAYFLVAHGSRSPQSQQSLHQLAHYFRAAIAQNPSTLSTNPSTVWVGTGCLEFQGSSLSQQLVQFYQSLPPTIERIHVLPIFLLPGNHVRQDIPLEIKHAQEAIKFLSPKRDTQSPPFALTPHLGSHPQLKDILQAKMDASHLKDWILLGHGSRRSEGNRSIEKLARSLNVTPAFWTIQPSLADQVTELMEQGIDSIGVIPYFLFSGKITEAIATQSQQLCQHHPELTLEVLSPLNPSHQLAEALLALSQSSSRTEALQAKAI